MLFLSEENMKFKLFSRLLLSVSTLLTLAHCNPCCVLRDAGMTDVATQVAGTWFQKISYYRNQ